MRILALAIVAFMVLVSGALLAPINYYVTERHALAHLALASGWASGAAALLSPLAHISDARALNNLGVLRARGIGTERNAEEARRLFGRAAEHGSARARLNAVMLDNGPCRGAARAAATAAELAPVARADPVAANLIHDCLYFDATSKTLADRDLRSIIAATQVQSAGDPNGLLHAGWAMLNLARTTTIPDFSDPNDEQRYDDIVLPIARKAMELLFAAAESGAAGAYEPLGILSMQFGQKLGDDPLAVRLRDRDNWEWLEAGAENGDWGAQCRIAEARMTDLRYGGRPYTREAFNDAVALAHRCIDRQEDKREPSWFAQPEWLVVTPRLYLQTRPTLEIGSAAATLNGLKFFDADRQLNAANGATRGSP